MASRSTPKWRASLAEEIKSSSGTRGKDDFASYPFPLLTPKNSSFRVEIRWGHFVALWAAN